jgi:DNA adenine methylase
MRTASPLRYPGGKASMSGLIGEVRRLNGLRGAPIGEPFAGGAGASLALLFREETTRVLINDRDAAVFAFWWTLLHRQRQFQNRLENTPLSIREWRTQCAIVKDGKRRSRLERGFAAFYLNRCNRSGIIMNGGPIGGIHQSGEWKIDARFNRQSLADRCAKVGEYKDRIDVSTLDGLQFIKETLPTGAMLFIDPPYYHKGRTLYLNSLNQDYHEELANLLRSNRGRPWLLTYDDCPEIRRLYHRWAKVVPFKLRYVAAEKRAGAEILIVPKWMKLPKTQGSAAVKWHLPQTA